MHESLTSATQKVPYSEIQKIKLLHDESFYYIEINPFIFYANQWTSLYVIENCIMKS